MDEITKIETEFGTFYTCNNCGATAELPEAIKHHDTCTPGEAKYWKDFYNEANKEEEVIKWNS